MGHTHRSAGRKQEGRVVARMLSVPSPDPCRSREGKASSQSPSPTPVRTHKTETRVRAEKGAPSLAPYSGWGGICSSRLLCQPSTACQQLRERSQS